MAKLGLELADARMIAGQLAANMAVGCDRIEIAGSIRRGKPVVGDIEIVCIPRPDRDLFGQPTGVNQLTGILAVMIDQGAMKPGNKCGPKFRNFIVLPSGIGLDLFMVTPETWGVLYAIRTGPAGYAKALVTERCHGGLLKDGCHVDKGRLYERGTAVATPEERDFLDYCGGWVAPEEREKLIPGGWQKWVPR